MENMNNPINKISSNVMRGLLKIKCDKCGVMTEIDSLISYPINELEVCPTCHNTKVTEVNFYAYIKHVSLNFTRYEFRTNEDVYTNEDYETDNFCLVIDKETEVATIYVVNDEDYWVYEEATERFDLNHILDQLDNLDPVFLSDCTLDYLKFLVKDMENDNEYNN